MTIKHYKELYSAIAEETNVKKIEEVIGETEKGKLSVVYKDNDIFLTLGNKRLDIDNKKLIKILKELWKSKTKSS